MRPTVRGGQPIVGEKRKQQNKQTKKNQPKRGERKKEEKESEYQEGRKLIVGKKRES